MALPITPKAASAFAERVLINEFTRYGTVVKTEPYSVEWTLRKRMHRHMAGSMLCDHRAIVQLGTCEADAKPMRPSDAIRALCDWPAGTPCWCLWTGAKWMAQSPTIHTPAMRHAIDQAKDDWRDRVERWFQAHPEDRKPAPAQA